MTSRPEIAARLAAATPGPWRCDDEVCYIWAPSQKGGEFTPFDIRGWGYYTGKGSGALGLGNDEAVARQRADAEFVAHAREDIPFLLREIAELEARVAGLERERDESLCLAEGPSTLLDLARGALERGSQLQAAEARIADLEAKVAELEQALRLFRSLVNEGGVPRYTVTEGAALNALIEEVVDPLLNNAALTGTSDTGEAG